MKSNKAATDRPNETYRKVSEKESPRKAKALSTAKTEWNLPWPIEMLSPRSLRPAQRNARTHSKKQIRQIADQWNALDLPIR